MIPRIGIDAGLFPESDRGGLAVYRRELVRALLALEEELELHVYGRGATALAPPSRRCVPHEASGAVALRVPGAYRRLWLRRAARRDRLDLLHHPLGWGAGRGDPPEIVSVHDMLCMRSGELDYPVPIRGARFRARKRYHRRVIPASLRRSRLVLASSESTRDDVIRLARVAPERVRVVPLATAPIFRSAPPPAAREAVLARLGLDPGYVLAFSSIDPRKNTHRVVAACRDLEDAEGRPARLVLVLTQSTHRESLVAAARSVGVTERVHMLPHPSDADLVAVYAGAAVLAYPSLFEGFGLPLLEAMGLGVAAVAAPVGGMREVGGDAVEWVDPTSVPAIAAGLARILGDPLLRERRIARGRERALGYSWERTARATLDAYREVLG